MSKQKQEHKAGNKKEDCGCGCVGATEKKNNEKKSVLKKPEK